MRLLILAKIKSMSSLFTSTNDMILSIKGLEWWGFLRRGLLRCFGLFGLSVEVVIDIKKR